MKHYRLKYLFAICLGCICLYACNPEIDQPVYLQVDTAMLSTVYYTQGTASANITDIWVTVNGKNMGVYELPATIPVFASGNTNLQLTAGIKMNGLAIKRPLYPFYNVDIRNMDLVETMTYKLTPQFTYKESTDFEFKEDFEDAGVKFGPVDSSSNMVKTSDASLVFTFPNEKSRYSGMIQLLPEDSTFFEVQTTKTFIKNSKMTYCFMEMNYNFTHNVEVGIYYHYNGRNYQYPICGIYGASKNGRGWKKIYINLTEALNSSTMIKDFEIYFKGIKNKQDTAIYLFDNIKVLYI